MAGREREYDARAGVVEVTGAGTAEFGEVWKQYAEYWEDGRRGRRGNVLAERPGASVTIRWAGGTPENAKENGAGCESVVGEAVHELRAGSGRI